MDTLLVKEEKAQGYIYLPGEGKTLSIRGASLAFKAVTADTGGAWSAIEYVAPPHFTGPSLHWHKETLEGFYILSGTLTFQLEEEIIKAPAGSFALIPPGTLHKFSNEEPVPASFLAFCSPSGVEGYFEELADLLQQGIPPAPDQMATLSARYDIYPPAARV